MAQVPTPGAPDETPQRTRPVKRVAAADDHPTAVARQDGDALRATELRRRTAAKFVGRVSQLDLETMRAAVLAWRELMATATEAWFAAERAAARAVQEAQRTAQQRTLLAQMADGVLHGVWYREARTERDRRSERDRRPELQVGATEASAQYVATVAMLALLVRDRISAGDFALLYEPFDAEVPLEALEHD